MLVRRERAAVTTGRNQWQAVQGKQIKKEYSAEKAAEIISKRRSQGLWYPDEDFGEDEDDPQLHLTSFF